MTCLLWPGLVAILEWRVRQLDTRYADERVGNERGSDCVRTFISSAARRTFTTTVFFFDCVISLWRQRIIDAGRWGPLEEAR